MGIFHDTALEEVEVSRSGGSVYLDAETGDLLFDKSTAIALAKDILNKAGAPQDDGLRVADLEPNEALLRVAAIHKLPVSFRYAKRDGAIIETRTVVPENFLPGNDGTLIVNGTDQDRGGIRAFRLDRIKGQVRV